MAGKEGEGEGEGRGKRADWVKPFHGSIRPKGVSATPCGLLAPPSKMAPATPTHPTPEPSSTPPGSADTLDLRLIKSNTCSLGLGFTLTLNNLPA